MGVEASAKAEAQNGAWTGTRRRGVLLGLAGGLRATSERVAKKRRERPVCMNA